ncbi:MAG: hypothetical protein KatS3mg126_2293 [Lysobacteraceae bacterium]|nr:MAG: hypothetical protein KatS3mg126_2293 [Xanthomonadaceae bacterium]
MRLSLFGQGPDLRPRLFLLGLVGLLALVTAWVYAPGLYGPLLLDDFGNLEVVTEYLHGKRSAWSVILGGFAGPTGRPLAMASFVLDASLFGDSLWHAKRTSLAVHILNGALVLLVLHRLLLAHPRVRQRALGVAALLALVWLLLPIQVSTVLYLVQRMTLLSASFVLAGLWLYLVARERILRGQRGGLALLWLGLPGCTLLALLSKENGVLLPLLAAVLELGLRWSTPVAAPAAPRQGHLDRFFAAVLLVPGLVGGAYLLRRVGGFEDAYLMRDFDMVERLLTEARVLWDYAVATLLPNAPQLGLFHDRYPISHGLLDPPTTLLAILAWIGALLAGWGLRRHEPLIATGVLFFLAGHALEAGPLPLEIYFEHRNYLPSLGLLLAATGVVAALAARLPAASAAMRRTIPVLLLAVPATMAWATHGRALVWSSEALILQQELRFRPDSPRLQSIYAAKAMEVGDLPTALHHIELAERYAPARQASSMALWRVVAYCAARQPAPAELFSRLQQLAGPRIEFFGMIALERLLEFAVKDSCPREEMERLADILVPWMDRLSLPAHLQVSWRSRLIVARLLTHLGRFEDARRLAIQAWEDSGHVPSAGFLAFQLAATFNDYDAAREILKSLQPHRGRLDHAFDQGLDAFAEWLSHAQGKPSASPTGTPSPP